VFQEEGGVRDPEVVWVDDRWMMIYCRRVDFGGRYGESVVSYRFSDDLFHWGARAGDLVRDLEDTQWFGSSESPFLYQREEGWYLFVTHVGPVNYHRTKVWFSEDPTNFGADEDRIGDIFTHATQIFEYEGKTWLTNTGCHAFYYGYDFPKNIGVEVAELAWKVG
jgi:beta-fructofuranosidase